MGQLIVPCKCTGDQQFVHRWCLDSERRLNPENMFSCQNCGYQYSVDSMYIESSLQIFLDQKLKHYKSNLLMYLFIEELLLVISMFLIEPNWVSQGLSLSFIIVTYVCHLIINLFTVGYSIHLCQMENILDAFVDQIFTQKNFALLVFGNSLLFICNFIQPIIGVIFQLYFYLQLLKKLKNAASKSVNIPIVSDLAAV